jgi:hypothetical protein
MDNRIVSVEEISCPDTDSGYVAFEIIGKENYRGERQHTRGVNSISVDAVLASMDSPFKAIERNGKHFEPLYYEPYYELMRQTLLGWRMVSANEYNCDEYIHLYVVPKGKQGIIAKYCARFGRGNLKDAWLKILKMPDRFKIISPEQLLEPLKNESGTDAIFKYLVSVHKVGYFMDRPRTLVRCICSRFVPKRCAKCLF